MTSRVRFSVVRLIKPAALLAAVLLLSLGTLLAQQDRIVARIENSRTVGLAGRVHPLANPRNDRGPVEDSFQVTGIALLLKRSFAQQDDIRQLLDGQQNPASPNYHKWLTPEQYADRFGLSAGDVGKIAVWLNSQGFTIGYSARGRSWISFSGTAGQIRNAFHTEIHRYSVNGKTHYANAADPSIPAALAEVVAGIRGLHDFHLQSRYRAAPQMTTASGVHHVVPGDLAAIYDVTPLYQAGIDGTGQAIAIAGETAIRTSDIQTFRANLNLPAPKLQQVLVPGSPDPGVVDAEIGEADMDIEWSGAMAPGATVVYVYSTDVFQSLLYAIDQDLAPVLSTSYGLCEQGDLVDLPSDQAAAQQANAQGMTWLAAAGDDGAADCEDNGFTSTFTAQTGLAVDAPGSIPEVTSVGGTEFADQSGSFWNATNTANGVSAISYIPETAWNDTSKGKALAAGGGGASMFFPAPAWQTGPGVPNDGFRHVPDVSFNASSSHDASYIVSQGSVQYSGGTSVAAPILAGMLALLNHYLVTNGVQAQPGLGNINPTLYRLAQTTTNVFHDIAIGDNIVPCAIGSPNCTTGSFGYTAGVGFDQATGLGSVDLYNLAGQWSSQPAVSSAVVASIDQNPVFQQKPDAKGNSWVFTLKLNEEAGIATALTGFSIDGVDYSAQIATYFGAAAIPAYGSISTRLGYATVAVPATKVFGFTGLDASGAQWTAQLSIPFEGTQIPLTVSAASNAASGQQAYAPGMMLTVSGNQLSAAAQTAATIPLPLFLAGFQATINGVDAPIYSVAPGQAVIQIPFETPVGMASLEVLTPYQATTYNLKVTASAPGIFTLPDGSVSPVNSGGRGQTATLFITGAGLVKPSIADGGAPSATTPLTQLPKPTLPVSLTVGGVTAAIQFVGVPSGKVGQTEIDFQVPAKAALGVQPVVVTVGAVASPPANFTVTQ